MAGQMPVVVVSLRRRSLAQGAGLTPPSFLPLQPVFPLAPRHLPPTGPSAPIISTIPIHLLRRTTTTPAATTTNLLLIRCLWPRPLFIVLSFLFCSLPSRYCHLVPSGHGGLCASSALGLAKPLLQPSRSISSAHFLLLKAVVLAVADGRRPGRRAAAFPAWLMVIPSDARPTCFHHIERAVR